jgi:hypothetical protein
MQFESFRIVGIPNSKHIDAIFEHALKYPRKWEVQTTSVSDKLWEESVELMNNLGLTNLLGEVFNMTGAVDTNNTTRNIITECMVALIINDTCGYLLKEKPEHVELLASLGQSEAILLLPAVRAMSHE